VLGLLLGAGVALLVGEPQTVAIPAPSPVPTPPEPPVGTRKKKTPPREADPRPVLATVSPARRYAGLDGASHGTMTASDTALRRLLGEIIALLPRHATPFILSFAAQHDAHLAHQGASLAAAGLARLGADAALVTGDADIAGHRFVLVDATHELAGHADLEILVIAQGERIRRPLTPATIVFELPARTQLTAAEPARAAG